MAELVYCVPGMNSSFHPNVRHSRSGLLEGQHVHRPSFERVADEVGRGRVRVGVVPGDFEDEGVDVGEGVVIVPIVVGSGRRGLDLDAFPQRGFGFGDEGVDVVDHDLDADSGRAKLLQDLVEVGVVDHDVGRGVRRRFAPKVIFAEEIPLERRCGRQGQGLRAKNFPSKELDYESLK